MRRSVVPLAIVVVTALGCGTTTADPALRPGAGVPSDVAALAQSTWERFLTSVPDGNGCLQGLQLETSRELPERGRYEPERRVVTLRIPHTAPRLQRTLTHEFAHHLDFSCPDEQLRAAFLAAQEHPPGTEWLGSPSSSLPESRQWAMTPSEQWAEAVTELVLGPGSASPTVPISSEAAELLRRWARGGTVGDPP